MNMLSKFRREEGAKPGAFKRNVDSDFIPAQVNAEKHVDLELLGQYIPSVEIDLIRQFINSYIEYLNALPSLESLYEGWCYDEDEDDSVNMRDGRRSKGGQGGFNDIFVDPNDEDKIEACLDILKKVDPPIITMNNEFNLGPRSKGAISAWVDVMKKGIIKSSASDEDVAWWLNSNIKGLNLYEDGRTLRNVETRAYDKYKDAIIAIFHDLPFPV